MLIRGRYRKYFIYINIDAVFHFQKSCERLLDKRRKRGVIADYVARLGARRLGDSAIQLLRDWAAIAR
jgi:hypothetical protein